MKYLKLFEGVLITAESDYEGRFDFDFIQDCFQEILDSNQTSVIEGTRQKVSKISGIGNHAHDLKWNDKYLYRFLICFDDQKELSHEITAIFSDSGRQDFRQYNLDYDYSKDIELQEMLKEAKDRLEEKGYVVLYGKQIGIISVCLIK